MTRQWKGTRVAMAVRRANRHRYPILQKPLVIPNETANWRWNEESHRTKEILKKQNFIPN
jgi:hypothetical protein